MRNVIVSAILALGLAACGSSPPAISLDDLAGDYRAFGCPAVQVRGDTMHVGDQRIRLKFIRIKLDDVIVANPHPRVKGDKGCGFEIIKGPIYLPVRQKDGGITIEIETADGESVVAFRRVKSAPSDGN